MPVSNTNNFPILHITLVTAPFFYTAYIINQTPWYDPIPRAIYSIWISCFSIVHRSLTDLADHPDTILHSSSDGAPLWESPCGRISLFLVLSQIRFERFFMNESIYILFISCYLEGVLKEEEGGVLLIFYSILIKLICIKCFRFYRKHLIISCYWLETY